MVVKSNDLILIVILLLQIACAKQNRRLERNLKGGGGGGGGSSSTVVDPNNFEIPHDFEFFVHQPWPPKATYSEFISMLIEIIVFLIFFFVLTHIYGLY